MALDMMETAVAYAESWGIEHGMNCVEHTEAKEAVAVGEELWRQSFKGAFEKEAGYAPQEWEVDLGWYAFLLAVVESHVQDDDYLIGAVEDQDEDE